MSKMRKKWLIIVGEDPKMRNAMLDTRRSMKQILLGVSLFVVFLANRKVKTPLIVINTK